MHFELKFNPRLMFGTDVIDLTHVLKKNLGTSNGNVSVESFQLRQMHLSSLMSSSSLSPNLPTFSHILDDNFADAVGKCVPAFQLPSCPPIYKNLTSYPNLFGHNNADEMKEDLVIFR